MNPRRVALTVICALVIGSGYLRSADTIPNEIDSRTFWRMVTDMSEEGGYFRFQFMSNEVEFPSIIPQLKKDFKPGGVYLIVDHSGEPGSGLRDTDTLHRIDEATVKQQVVAAGFDSIGVGHFNGLRNLYTN